MSLQFLSKKSWHTAKTNNIESVFIAEEKAKAEKKAAEERERTIERERELEDLERAIGGEEAAQKLQLGFMYKAPPGGEKTDEKTKDKSGRGNIISNLNVQEDDDPATIEFRRMLAGEIEAAEVNMDPAERKEEIKFDKPEEVKRLEGNADYRSELEKSVGRNAGVDISLNELVARFPELKNAPMAKGMQGTSVQVKFNALGKDYRMVKCLVCGEWGHNKGDRQCKKGFNPFAMSSDKFDRSKGSLEAHSVRTASPSIGQEDSLSSYRNSGGKAKRKADEANLNNDKDGSDSSSSSSSNRKKKKHKKHKKHKASKKSSKKEKKKKRKH